MPRGSSSFSQNVHYRSDKQDAEAGDESEKNKYVSIIMVQIKAEECLHDQRGGNLNRHAVELVDDLQPGPDLVDRQGFERVA